jgi:hypothetical protein
MTHDGVRRTIGSGKGNGIYSPLANETETFIPEKKNTQRIEAVRKKVYSSSFNTIL